MPDMPRPRPQYLQRETTRHGKVVWYVRKDDGPRTRVEGEYGSEDFMENYRNAVDGIEAAKPKGPQAGTVAWLIQRYRETSSGWAGLSTATKRQRENIFKHVVASIGDKPFKRVTRSGIIKSRDRRSKTPAQARNFLDAMRGLFRWARSVELVKIDPTEGVDNPGRPKNDGFAPWTEEDVEAYHAKWPIGTKERVWVDVLLYTGLRRGDAVRIGRQHIRDGIATIKTEKSNFTVEVSLPVLPVLQQTLDAGPTSDLAFICGDRGDPLEKETFGNYFRRACREAGLGKGKSAHGVRKIAATTAANNGATESQLEAIFGWRGGAMASLYTRAANRRRLAKEAMATLGRNAGGTSYPRTEGEVSPHPEKDATISEG